MYGKIFDQIYDSSIAEDYMTRFVFMDLIVLADKDGTIDMTLQAIARRTNVPVDIVERAIKQLEGPDPHSRTKEHNGARLLKMDDHRSWGWTIVNHRYYRDIATESARREATIQRVQRYREKQQVLGIEVCNTGSVNKSNSTVDVSASVGSSDGIGNAKGKGFQIPTAEDCIARGAEIGLPEPQSQDFFDYYTSKGWTVGAKAPMKDWHSAMSRWKRKWIEGGGVAPSLTADVALDQNQIVLGTIFGRSENDKWTADELGLYRSLEPVSESDVDALWDYYQQMRKLPQDKDKSRQSLKTLLENFHAEVDKARRFMDKKSRETCI